MSAELAARRTAAAAVLADFRRALTTSPPGNGHGMHYWATRLAEHLGQVLNAPAGHASLGRDDLRTMLDALDVAANYKRDRAANCPDCEASPADLCGTCEWRLHVADEYDALAHRLEDQ